MIYGGTIGQLRPASDPLSSNQRDRFSLQVEAPLKIEVDVKGT